MPNNSSMRFFRKRHFLCFCFYIFIFLCPCKVLGEESLKRRFNKKWNPLFPKALFVNTKPDKLSSYHVKDLAEHEKDLPDNRLQSVLLNNDIFALYGKPGAYTMGILGQYKLKDLDPIMKKFTGVYDAVNGEKKIIPALYIIYGTCWPKGEIGILPDSVTEQYIKYAAERGWYVFLDHQIGKYTVEQAMRKILPFLKYDNVHLALDPEWRTLNPMRVIGSVSGDEVNKAQEIMNNYIKENNIGGRRMLVIHQFNAVMIKNRHKIKSNYERVQLIHCADGFGPPHLKKETYKYNAAAKNIPIKSFKLFLKPKVAGAGYDSPLMSPKEVMNLNPRPYLIMYQ